MSHGTWNFTLHRGEDTNFRLGFYGRDSEGNLDPVDLTGSSFEFRAYGKNAGKLLLLLQSAKGEITRENNKLTLIFSQNKTRNIPYEAASFELFRVITATGKRTCLVAGEITFHGGVYGD